MTNKEKYKRAFSTLHASGKNSLEVEKMEKMKKAYRMRKTLAACAAVAVVFGSMTVAYAADAYGIQEKISAWFHGARTEMNVTDDGGGNYSYTFTDEDGKMHEGAAGGVAFDAFGNEIPLSAEDVLGQLAEEVEEDADGNVWLYYYDRQVNITDYFDGDGNCKVALKNDGGTAYGGDIVYIDISMPTEEEEAQGGSYSYETSTTAPSDAERYTLID